MKVIFVGNGSSVKDYKAGSVIDEFDIVIRFNRGFLEGIDKYKEFVGSKTDIVVVHEGFIYPDGPEPKIDSAVKEWNWDEKMVNTDMVHTVITDVPEVHVMDENSQSRAKDLGVTSSDLCYIDRLIRCREAFKYNKCFEGKYVIMPRNVSRNLKNIVDFGETWPSTGLCGIYFNADKLVSIGGNSVEFYTYGFDGADKKYKYYHYFNHTDTRTTEFHWRPDRKDHNLNAEGKCLNILKEQFNIKELKDEL
jgi:hypothetical protein